MRIRWGQRNSSSFESSPVSSRAPSFEGASRRRRFLSPSSTPRPLSLEQVGFHFHPIRRWRGCVDLLSAGFPCQSFSAAGKRQADTDDRHLWPHVRRVINGARPALVFLENVGALISTRQRDGRPAYMVVRNELERLGYRVTETLVRASDVGAPHQRERIFILGYASSLRHNRGVPWSDGSADTGRPVGQRTGRDFPPGPGDTDAWAAILAERPELAPALAVARRADVWVSEWSELDATSHDHGRSEAMADPAGGSARTSGSGGETRGTTKGDAAQSALRGVADGVAGALEHRTQRLRLLGNGVVPLAAAFAFRACADALGLAIEELRHTHTGDAHDSRPAARP